MPEEEKDEEEEEVPPSITTAPLDLLDLPSRIHARIARPTLRRGIRAASSMQLSSP